MKAYRLFYAPGFPDAYIVLTPIASDTSTIRSERAAAKAYNGHTGANDGFYTITSNPRKIAAAEEHNRQLEVEDQLAADGEYLGRY